MRNNICLISFILLWAVVLATAQQQESGDNVPIVALTYDIPPYITNEGTGGLETAILISAALDKGIDEFTYRQMSYDEVESAIGRGDANIALGVTLPTDGSYEKENNGIQIYFSYPSWPFHNYVFTKFDRSPLYN